MANKDFEKKLLEIRKKCEDLFPPEIRVQVINMLIGEGIKLVKFIQQCSDFISVPVDVLYPMAQFISILSALRTKEKNAEVSHEDITFSDLEIDDKLLLVVKELVKYLKKEGKWEE